MVMLCNQEKSGRSLTPTLSRREREKEARRKGTLQRAPIYAAIMH